MVLNAPRAKPTLKYWAETEVHVYAFSIAANVLLSFFPFLLVMMSYFNHVTYWPGARRAIALAIYDFFPGVPGEFIARNLQDHAERAGGMEWLSIMLLLFTANGVFMPLEVALNRAWKVTANRSFIRNQLISTLLIFSCGALVLLTTGLNASASRTLQEYFGGAAKVLAIIFFKIAAFPVTVFVLFFVYKVLPNAEVPWRPVLRAAMKVGLALEALKFLNLALTDWLYAKFTHEYGPFKVSVTILTWSFLAAMIVLAGAEWTARTSGTDRDRIRITSQPTTEGASDGTE